MRIFTSFIFACVALFAIETAAHGEQKKVFILAGQSNAVGQYSDANDLPAELQDPQADVLFWYEIGPQDSITNYSKRILSDDWTSLQYQSDPNYSTFGDIDDGFGPEIKCGRVLADNLPWDVAVIKFAINATSLAQHWDSDTPGPLYSDLISIVNSAMTEITNLGHTASIWGIFWMQGEWDARNTTFANAYESNLTAFIQQLRSDLGDPDLPFILGRLNSEIYLSDTGITQANLAIVRTAQANVNSAVPHTTMVNTDDLPLHTDSVHFTAAGHLLLGERFANAFLDMLDDPVPTLFEGGLVAMVFLILSAGVFVILKRK